MALVSGFFNTTQFGRGVSDVGEDVARIGLAERQFANQRALLATQAEREERLERLRAELWGAAGGRTRGRSGAGTGRASGDTFAPEDREAIALAESGMDRPTFEAVRRRVTEGPQKDRVSIGAPGEQEGEYDEMETAASIAAGKQIPNYHRGIMASIFGPENYKSMQEGTTERRKRDLTLDAPDTDTAIQGGRRVNARQGRGEYKEGGGVIYNEFVKDSKPHAVGESTIAKNRAEAAKDARTDPNKGTEEAKRKERREIENAITQTENTLRGYEQNIMFVTTARKNPNGEEAQTMARLRKRIADLNSELEAVGIRPKPEAPKPAPAPKAAAAAAAKAPYPDGTRLRGKDGKTYVVRDGKPVLEGR